MSRWTVAVMIAGLLVAQGAAAAPRGSGVTPEGNPVDGSAPATVSPRAATPAAPAPPPPTQLEGLVITARPAAPPVDTVSAFVADVSSQSANGRLARWDRKICPGVIGLKDPYGQQLIDRIALIATTVGLQVGAPGCKPNLIVVATDDSQTMIKMLVDKNPTAFGKWEDGITRGRAALTDFIETPRPVRWWHVTHVTMADGRTYTRGSQVLVRSMGRVRGTTRDNFDHVIIMIDVSKVGVIRFSALADYVAMVGLAQIDPETDPSGVPSVLNLFAARDKGATQPLGLTGWDVAYLQALYNVDPNVIKGSRQENQIVRDMATRLGAQPVRDEDAE